VAEERRLDGAVIKVDNKPLAVELYPQLRLVHVEESIQLPDFFFLHFDDPDFKLFDKELFKLGTRIEIAFRAEGDPVVVTTGEVTTVSVEPGVSGRHELVVSGLDLTHRLARGPKTRTFLKQTDSAVATSIANEYGLETDVDSTSRTIDYLIQVNETDYTFLRRRASEIGYDFWISENTFHFKRIPDEHAKPQPMNWGDNLLKFKVRFSSTEHCDEVTVTSWNPVDKTVVTGRASYPDFGTDAPAADDMAAATKQAFGKVTRAAGQFPASSQAEADSIAVSLLMKAAGGLVVLRGEARGNPWLGAGGDIKLDKVGDKLAGKYRLTSVEHIYGTDRPYITRFVCGGKQPDDLTDLLGGGPARPDRKGWGSLVVGVVTNNDDEEKLGRVKVRFPTLSDADESTWARVVTLGAGPQRGIQWMPEKDDEVLVGFELDDTVRPVVLGGMWSRADKPPQPDAVEKGKVNSRVLATRKNHRLLFIDDPTSTIELSLGDAKCSLHLEQKETRLTAEQKLVITANEIEITAQNKLTVNGQGIEISAGSSELKATGQPINLNP
jgi:uncharacterized protein involved in type VI secretion and phage assembly